MGRKKILLLGWLTHGVRLAAGAAQARRDALSGTSWQVGPGGRRLCARGWRGEAGPALWAMCASGRACGLARKAEQAWAAAVPSSFLFPFLFLFLFVLCYTFFMYINQSGIFLLWYNVPW